jgi:periplasmic copper chaperone A
MRMRELERLELPARHTVRLAPSGTHLMLLELKRPLRIGDSITLDFTLIDKAGRTRTVRSVVPVRAGPLP